MEVVLHQMVYFILIGINITLVNVIISNITAQIQTLLYVENSIVNITNCDFNNVNTFIGAIQSRGTALLDHDIENTNQISSFNITDCKVLNCYSQVGNGVIQLFNSLSLNVPIIYINNSIFNNNSGVYGILESDYYSISINDCSFDSNFEESIEKAQIYSGTVTFYRSTILFDGCTFGKEYFSISCYESNIEFSNSNNLNPFYICDQCNQLTVNSNSICKQSSTTSTLNFDSDNDNNNYINNQFLNNNEEDEIIKKIKGKENVKIKVEKKNNNKFLGIIIVFLITLFMATSAELSQFIVSGDYKAPFTIIWFSTIILSFSLVIEFILLKIELIKERKDGLKINFDDVKHIDYNINSSISGSYFKVNLKLRRTINPENGETINTDITFKKLFIISIPMSILFVALNWIWMLAISMTEVSISTALYQSASVFCFFLSIIILKEKVKILKTISVIIFMGGIVGIAITTVGTSKGEYPHAIKGEILMIISAAMWGLYEVLTSKFIGDANRTIVHTYMGLIAFVNLILGIPVIVILNVTKFEPFSVPSISVFGMLLLNALVVTSPLFVRSGELMVIVATLLFDIVIKHMKLPLLALPGYSLIVIGFILSVYIESSDIKQQQQQEKEKEKQKNNNGETESLLNY
ncbi:hypothetical protein ACTFIW_000205 [Dictyostelium discoideum]